MTPYLEVRSLPRSSQRSVLVLVVCALLVVPVGVLIPVGDGDPSSGIARALAMLAILLLAPVLGLALGRPRAFITVDAEAGEITRRTTGHLPDPRAQTERWPITAARVAELEELGTPSRPRWGVQILLDGDEPLHLNSYADRDFAQDTLDHLVLLGIPGHSRAHDREASYAQTPPEQWL
ncbi:MAG: hypothetical protein PGN13_12760 [Patulibacter minatonensis]